MVFLATDCSPALERGNSSFTTCGFETADANRKNNIRKNMMSFRESVKTLTSDLFRFALKFIRKTRFMSRVHPISQQIQWHLFRCGESGVRAWYSTNGNQQMPRYRL